MRSWPETSRIPAIVTASLDFSVDGRPDLCDHGIGSKQDSGGESGRREGRSTRLALCADDPESHFTAENAAGASNWLLMFSTSWPSFSVLATTATHSGSTRKAPQRFSRSAMLSQASM